MNAKIETSDTETKYLDAAEFAAILSTTLALAADAGLTVGVRNSPANERRPAGILVYLSGLAITPDGRITNEPETQP